MQFNTQFTTLLCYSGARQRQKEVTGEAQELHAARNPDTTTSLTEREIPNRAVQLGFKP